MNDDYRYWAYGLGFRSQVLLPELPEMSDARKPEVSIRIGDVPELCRSAELTWWCSGKWIRYLERRMDGWITRDNGPWISLLPSSAFEQPLPLVGWRGMLGAVT